MRKRRVCPRDERCLLNLPESLGGAVGMRQQGRSSRFALGVWSVTALILAVAVVLASLADTLMPDTYREGGKRVAFATAADEHAPAVAKAAG